MLDTSSGELVEAHSFNKCTDEEREIVLKYLHEAIEDAMQVDPVVAIHTPMYADGMYIAVWEAPAGCIVKGAMHKIAHFNALMKGKVRVYTASGVQVIEAPYHGVAPAGIQRTVHVLEDCTWVMTFPTKETDPAKVRAEFLWEDAEEGKRILQQRK